MRAGACAGRAMTFGKFSVHDFRLTNRARVVLLIAEISPPRIALVDYRIDIRTRRFDLDG